MKNSDNRKNEKLQAVHIRKKVHKKFKSFCTDNDMRVGDTAEKALLQYIELSDAK